MIQLSLPKQARKIVLRFQKAETARSKVQLVYARLKAKLEQRPHSVQQSEPLLLSAQQVHSALNSVSKKGLEKARLSYYAQGYPRVPDRLLSLLNKNAFSVTNNEDLAHKHSRNSFRKNQLGIQGLRQVGISSQQRPLSQGGRKWQCQTTSDDWFQGQSTKPNTKQASLFSKSKSIWSQSSARPRLQFHKR